MTYTAEQILHDRATRGETLTPAEQTQLDQWYAELDRQESQVLFGEDEPPFSALIAKQAEVTQLRAQVDQSLAQLQQTVQRLQEVSAQNDQLRHENALLRAKVAEQGLLELA